MSADLTSLKAALAAHLNANAGKGIRGFSIGDRRFDYEEAGKLLDVLERLERRDAGASGASTMNQAEVVT